MLTQRQLFLRHLAQTSDSPVMLEVDRAEGVFVYDPSGKAYIDLISGISVANVGHCHPAVVEAVRRQAGRFMHTMVYGEYVQGPQVELARLLTAHLPAALDSVYFVNSGAEATEGAMKLAKRHTGRAEVLSCRHAYHGSTQGALSLMGDEYFKRAFRPLLPATGQIRYNNFDDLERIGPQTAAVFMEVVQAEAGVMLPAPGYLEAVRQRCDETGALLVFDEIQTGCGRTGTLFGFEGPGVVPDILLLAKGLGGGMPLGVFVASKNTMEALAHDPVLGHITTFGGHPVSCAAALASLQVLTEGKLWEAVPAREARFRQALEGHRAVRDLRSAGLMMAVELDSAAAVQQAMARCLELGVLTDWFLFAGNCLRIAPPLIISDREIDQACEALIRALDTLPA